MTKAHPPLRLTQLSQAVGLFPHVSESYDSADEVALIRKPDHRRDHK